MKVANWTKLEAKSPSRNVRRNCGISTSLRLFDMPQKANKPITSTVAGTNPRVMNSRFTFPSLMRSPSWHVPVDDFGGYLAGRGADGLHRLLHGHHQRIAVHEGTGERRDRGLAAQDRRGQVHDAANEVGVRFMMSAGANGIGTLDERVRRLTLEPASPEPDAPCL